MKIALTGSTGFIGYHLSRRLLDEGHTVYALVRRHSDTSRLPTCKNMIIVNPETELLTDYFKKTGIQGIIHLASLFISEHQSSDIGHLLNSNIKYGTWLLESAVHSDISWFINTGTFWQHYNDAEYDPVNLYAATKQAFETIAKYYIQTTDLNFVTLKLSDTFGPKDTRRKIFSLWDDIAGSKETLSMSLGEQLIDISFIDNVIDAFIRMLWLMQRLDAKNHCGKSYFVHSSKQFSLRSLSKIFEQATAKKLNIKWGERSYRKREVMHPYRIGKQVPGWKPVVSLEQGIKLTYGNGGNQ